MTNSALKSHEELLAKFSEIGLEDVVREERVITSSMAVGCALSDAHIVAGDAVYVVGGAGLRAAVASSLAPGVEVLGGDDRGDYDDFCSNVSARTIDALNPKRRVKAVVVGRDNDFDYVRMATAAAILRQGSNDVLFFATNRDAASASFSPDLLVPAAGAMVAAIETAAGRQAVDFGKPSVALGKMLCEKLALVPERTCMVGDRVDTDIRFGQAMGFRTALVLSGVSKAGCEDSEAADWVLESVVDFTS